MGLKGNKSRSHCDIKSIEGCINQEMVMNKKGSRLGGSCT